MRYAVMTAAILGALVLFAVEPNFTVTEVDSSTVYDWNNASLWSGSKVPNGSDAVVSLGEPSAGRLLLRIPAAYSFAVDSIVSAPSNTYWRFGAGASSTAVVSRVSVRTLEGYGSVWPIGFMYDQNWKINGALTGFDFTGTAEDPSVVPSYYLGTLPHFSVAAADGAAEIKRLYHQGTLLKTGSGRLTVGGSAGMGAAAFVEGGSLFIDGEAEERDDVPAAGAFMHLDASLASSVLTCEADGRTYVTNWSDVAGSGRCAFNVLLTRQSGTLDVSAACRVEVTVSASMPLAGKSFRIIAAEALYDSTELSRWTLNVSSPRAYSAVLTARDDGIYVKFVERGMRLIVK